VYILIVEDDRANRDLFRYQVDELPFPVEIGVASNGWDALGRIAQRRPDLVVMDLGLPSLDGEGVLTRIRLWDDDPLGPPPVVVITARDLSPTDYDRLRGLGAVQVFQKGRYDTQALVDAISAWRPGEGCPIRLVREVAPSEDRVATRYPTRTRGR
jgi:CheY-like chemotaxis protein